MKRIASIQDISCLGRCSLTVALPVISAMAVECAIVPTAVLSTHTMFPGFISRDLSDQLLPIARHWKSQNVTLDAICTGYLASPRQTEEVCDFFDLLAGPDTLLFVDPAMADHGKLYAGFGPEFPSLMAQVVSKAQILDHVWEYDWNGDAAIVESYISYLRRKLTVLGSDLQITSRRGAGYLLEKKP